MRLRLTRDVAGPPAAVVAYTTGPTFVGDLRRSLGDQKTSIRVGDASATMSSDRAESSRIAMALEWLASGRPDVSATVTIASDKARYLGELVLHERDWGARLQCDGRLVASAESGQLDWPGIAETLQAFVQQLRNTPGLADSASRTGLPPLPGAQSQLPDAA